MDKSRPQGREIGLLGEPQRLVSGRDSGDFNTNRKQTASTTSSSTNPGQSDTATDELNPKTSLVAGSPRNRNGRRTGQATERTGRDRRLTAAKGVYAAYGLLILGVGLAISHHLFYTYLNREAVDEAAVGQTWAIRIGSAFAYLFKTALVASIAVVYAQGFWFIVRRNLFEVGAIDNFFGLLTNPLMFLQSSLYGKARLLFALAMVSLLPISAVIAPGALTGSPTAFRCLN